MVEVKVISVRAKKDDKKLIETVVETVLKQEKITHSVDVFIMLTDNEHIHAINKEQRKVDKATDVLSFPMYDREDIKLLKRKKKDDVEEMLGDIIISIPKVKEQAKEYGHSYKRELAYLVTHGMLHLLGYDHMIEEEKAVMRIHEEKVLSKLNIFRD